MKQVLYTIKRYPFLAFCIALGATLLYGGIEMFALLEAYKPN